MSITLPALDYWLSYLSSRQSSLTLALLLFGGALVLSSFLYKWSKASQQHPPNKTPSTITTAEKSYLKKMFHSIRRPWTLEHVAVSVKPLKSALPKPVKPPVLATPTLPTRVKQPYDALLVLDVEATCKPGTDFQYPNEIIEWPVCLMRWKDKSEDGKAEQLEVVDEFRSFVKPTWRPKLSAFATDLTGITQAQVDDAPLFPEVVTSFSEFLAKHGLIDAQSGCRLTRFCWCSDGPYDIRDFVVKQCFISKIPMPDWLRGDVLDVRRSVSQWVSQQPEHRPNRVTLNISRQLRALGLSPFEGRQHSGIDDTRNIARIVVELARKGVRLEANTVIQQGRRWPWMGKTGEILEEFCLS